MGLRLEPQNITILSRRALSNEKLGNYSMALSDWTTVGRLEPWNMDVQSRLAKCHVFLGNNALAMGIYESMLRKDPQVRSCRAIFHLSDIVHFGSTVV